MTNGAKQNNHFCCTVTNLTVPEAIKPGATKFCV